MSWGRVTKVVTCNYLAMMSLEIVIDEGNHPKMILFLGQ